MALMQWRERPVAALAEGGVIGPDERLPWPQTTAMGVQHVVAMFGSTVLAPILILVVGGLVGFMVIALLLPIFKMSRAIH